jgi:hypothetical protein
MDIISQFGQPPPSLSYMFNLVGLARHVFHTAHRISYRNYIDTVVLWEGKMVPILRKHAIMEDRFQYAIIMYFVHIIHLIISFNCIQSPVPDGQSVVPI